MRILHTSDLHLRVDRKETVDALKSILEAGASNRIDLLTIGGDIFHSERDADALRPEIRGLFGNHSFDIIAIPGNHDGTIFTKGFDFGLKVNTDFPCMVHHFNGECVVALPYMDTPSPEILRDLKNAGTEHEIRILLLHCTLDSGSGLDEYGEEGGLRYFPITREMLSELQYDYVLAGHFHSRCEIRKLTSGGLFVYPGSPISHSTKELGPRYAVLVDTEKKKVTRVCLPTFYFDKLELTVVPGSESKAITQLTDWYQKKEADNCELNVAVKGIIRTDENKFRKSLEKAAPRADLDYLCRDVRAVLSHPLYRRFKKKLKKNVDAQRRTSVDHVVLESISLLLAGGELE